MSTRGKFVLGLLALGIVLLGTGVAVASRLLENVGLFVLTTAVLCGRNPPLWVYLVFLAVTVSLYALFPTGHPSVNAIPLILAYVFEHLDERRRERAAAAPPTVVDGDRPAPAADAPQAGSATRDGNPVVPERPTSTR